jgi:DNA-binding CsgD family transcriptional regulator
MTSIDIRRCPAPRAVSPTGPTCAEPGRPTPGPSRSDLLDGLPCGVAVVCLTGRLLALNAAAREAIVSGRHGLWLDGDVVQTDALGAAESWRRALCDAVGGRPRLIRLGDVLPVGLSSWPGEVGRSVAACTFAATQGRLETLARAYGALHGLTEGETAVLHGLIGGLAPKRIASLRGSTELTVRSQIKAVLAKTGCHGLRDLVGAVLKQPPLLEWRDDAPAHGATRGAGGRHLVAIPAFRPDPPRCG